MPEPAPESAGRLFAKLLFELVRTGQYESLAELVAALKDRCAALHIRWTPDDITDAIARVSSHRALIVSRPPPPPPPEPPPPIGRIEAAQIVAALPARPAIKTIADARLLSHAFVDKVKALRMVMDELEATEARCNALEKAVE